MIVDGVPLPALRTRTSEKWTEFDSNILPMPVAEMDFDLAQPIRDLLVSMILNSDTGYMGNTDHLNRNFVDFAKSHWGWDVDPNQIFLCTDVGVGMIEIARTIVSPGDTIMITSPVYVNMFNWIKELKCKLHDAPMTKNGLEYSLDLDAIEAGFKAGAKILFLCNPQNPTGSVHSRSDLSAIADLAKQYGAYVLSDEIHGPLVFDESEFVPFLSISDTAREVGVCVTSASKAWNLAGLKCAFIVTAAENTLALAKSMPMSVRFRASLLGAQATAKAFECVDWLEAMMATLDRNREFLHLQLKEKLPLAGYRIPNCSYLAWIDMSAYNLGENPAATLQEKGQIALTPGFIFGGSSEQFVRLNFATSEELIAEGVDRMVAAINA